MPTLRNQLSLGCLAGRVRGFIQIRAAARKRTPRADKQFFSNRLIGVIQLSRTSANIKCNVVQSMLFAFKLTTHNSGTATAAGIYRKATVAFVAKANERGRTMSDRPPVSEARRNGIGGLSWPKAV
ncbi:unnamed protein product [Protopolystoma xenopodis]|uniref:Uncharacterized protein n=1 Tax=Protopolystoma xenopodis TaxID=117903 RepID=A0A448WI97_9PLAT|nr:unnamed protein product [Protopolystoma xenopodis]